MAERKIVNKKPALTVGVKEAFFTQIETEDNEKVVYKNETVKIPSIKEFNFAVNSEATNVSGSNSLYDVIQGAKVVEVGLNLLTLDDKTKAAILGRVYNELANGYSVTSISEVGRPIAVAFTTEVPTSDGGSIFISIPKMKSTKELETKLEDMYEGYKGNPEEYGFKAMTVPNSGDLIVISGIIKSDDVEKVGSAWHLNPPQTNQAALDLIDTATKVGE